MGFLQLLRPILIALVCFYFSAGSALGVDPQTAGQNDTKAKKETAAESINKALDKTITVDFANQPLQEAIAKLAEQTKLNFIIDRGTIQQMGIAPEQAVVTGKLENVKLRSGLRRILSQYNLGYAIVGDMVLISTEDMAIHRQMRQRINLNLNKVPFQDALKELARETATNLVLDARVTKEASTAVTLSLEDVPLEVAVRLMANQAGLRPVRTGNVLYVTTKANAAELRNDGEGAGAVNPGIAMPFGSYGER
jgi:type II secretory pathway component GspD/PulD (secretin)